MADTTITSTRNELRSEFEALKQTCELPLIYLTKYFNDLRSKIDIDLRKKLNESIQKITDKIDLFETDCLTLLNERIEANEQVKPIDQLNEIEAMLNDSAAKNLEKITECLHILEINVLKQLFQNKTIVYCINSNLNNSVLDTGKVSSRINNKLIIINDEFIRPRAFKQM